MTESIIQDEATLQHYLKNRWIRVITALFAMVFVSVYEYSWTLYTSGIAKAFHTTATAAVVGGVFSTYVVVQAVTMWLFGRYADKHGPRLISIIGGLITGIGYIGSSFAPSLLVLYITYGFGSIGVGIIYATAISSALKWYTGKKRGMMVGLIDLGFGGGAFALSPLIKYIITETSNFRSGFLYIGIAQIIIIPIMGLFFIYPPANFLSPDEPKAGSKIRKRVKKGPGEYRVAQMVKTWQWTVIYVSFFLIVGAGLAVISHLVPIGEAKGYTVAAFLAVFLFPFANGFGRFVSGTVSDFLGRPLSMLIFFFISGFSMLGAALVSGAAYATLYIVLIMLAAFGWGPLFALYPPTVGDYYGAKHSGANYGFTYTSKALGGLFAGYGFSLILTHYPGHFFLIPLVIASIMAIVAGLMGLSLRPPKKIIPGVEVTEPPGTS
ncbi:MAG: MFS transporter [Candidatus Thermoplasmatota archaeon]|nr:MFS transporter [Candidatus Thermoplasmatota archaeon]MCL5665932.1 MFS transporter [Candidatus Thermoplasmatota archaeon]